MPVPVFWERAGTASKIMWVSNPMICAESRAYVVIIADQSCPGASSGAARERGHGRAAWRTLKLTAVAAGITFPHAAQAILVIRRRRPLSGKKRWSTQTSYAITSLAASQASPAQIAGSIRGQWGIEALHHVHDVTYGEDASQIRAGNGPPVMATLRNLSIAILKPAGRPSIAAACRYHARDATRTLATLGISPA